MRKCWALVAFVALSFASATSRSEPYTDSFELFRADLAARIAALAGDLPAAQQQEKAVLDKIAAALASPSPSFAGDVRTALRIAKLVKRKALHHSPLVLKFLEATYFLSADLNVLFAELRARVLALPPSKLRDKANAALDKVAQRLDATASVSDPVKRMNLLLGVTKGSGGAAKKVGKAEVAAGVTPCVPGNDSVVIEADGAPISLHHAKGQISMNSSGGYLAVLVHAYESASEAEGWTSFTLGDTFHGPGTYAISAPQVVGRHNGSVGYFDGVAGGTITFAEADPDTRRIRGSFDFQGRNPVVGVTRQFTGTFDLTCVKVFRP